MKRAWLSLILLCSGVLAHAQNAPMPELALDVNGRTDAVVARGWPLLIRAAAISADGQAVRIGVSGGAWTQALHLTVTDSSGSVQSWPVQLVPAASNVLSLSGIATTDAVWLLAPADSANIAPGIYNLSVILDTGAGAAAGTWSGSVVSNDSTVQLQAEPGTLSPDEESSKYLAFSAYAQFRGDTAGAQAALDTLITRQPDLVTGYAEKADLLATAGDYEGALSLAQQALQKFRALEPNPEEPPSLLTRRIGDLGLRLANKQAAGGGFIVTSVEPGSSETVLAPDSIASGYGLRLATGVTDSAGSLATSLGGTSVTITDSKGQSIPAALFYVSPHQVNYAVPAAAALGTATVKVTAGDGATSTGLVSIAPTQPGLFTFNAEGLVAGSIVRVTGGGEQVFEDLFTQDTGGNRVAAPVDVSTGQVFLVFYGTGIRGATASQVSVSVGGVDVPVTYAGPQGTNVGLDQVNVILPASLAGRGDVPVVVTAAGKRSNTARITVK